MPEVKLLCKYCGDIWKQYVFEGQQMPRCDKCKSSQDVKLISITGDSDVYGYNKDSGSEK